jgi:hypothetical protein
MRETPWNEGATKKENLINFQGSHTVRASFLNEQESSRKFNLPEQFNMVRKSFIIYFR